MRRSPQTGIPRTPDSACDLLIPRAQGAGNLNGVASELVKTMAASSFYTDRRRRGQCSNPELGSLSLDLSRKLLASRSNGDDWAG